MANLKIGYYATLVQRGAMNLDEVPEEVRGAVQSFIKTGKYVEETPAESTMAEPVLPVDTRHGALVLPEMCTCALPVQDLRDGIPVHFEGKNSVIFNGVEDMPTNVRYEVALVENTTAFFIHEPHVQVTTTTEGFELMIHGVAESGAEHHGKRILRVDLMIYSDNYHDMRITLYFCAI